MQLRQAGTAQRLQRFIAQRIELQVNFQPRFVIGQPRHKLRLTSDAQAVGVDHQMANRSCPRSIENGEEIGMQRRFAAGNLHHIRLAFIGHHGVEHGLDLNQ